jgi:hypothetical protein
MTKAVRNLGTVSVPKLPDTTFTKPHPNDNYGHQINTTGRQGGILGNYDLRTNLLVCNLFATNNLPFLLTLTSNSYQPTPYVCFFKNQKHHFGKINLYLHP